MLALIILSGVFAECTTFPSLLYEVLRLKPLKPRLQWGAVIGFSCLVAGGALYMANDLAAGKRFNYHYPLGHTCNVDTVR
ncbi:hypothetical protein P879_09845 [Paragonimus westermani]|uniref:Uncharacterized protein n=1 Tax=Paragonimus westermani TaxID=34504 RepID=A0A8T0DG78_9TREM|nr:hypothetical protein P879_09845 [Paragonimus westermani]